MKRMVILGSTGSIGVQTLDVVNGVRDRFEVVGLSAHGNRERLAEQAAAWGVKSVCVSRDTGAAGILQLLEETQPDLVMNGITGAAGLAPSARALELGADLALANKESLVMAGELLATLARSNNARIIPVDSEHSAIFQCLLAGRREDLRRIHLTASGGPFRGRTRAELANVAPEEALRHPTWKMGRKISIDSATLMNKALEVLEAEALFGLGPDQIEVVIHPQSIVHSLVEFQDGSLIAHAGAPDMRIPIQYALSHPQRWERHGTFSLLDAGRLDFEAPDHETFPSLRLAREVCRTGGSARVVFNAANEQVVAHFLNGRIPFLTIFDLIERALDQHAATPISGVNEALEVDHLTRRIIDQWTS